MRQAASHTGACVELCRQMGPLCACVGAGALLLLAAVPNDAKRNHTRGCRKAHGGHTGAPEAFARPCLGVISQTPAGTAYVCMPGKKDQAQLCNQCKAMCGKAFQGKQIRQQTPRSCVKPCVRKRRCRRNLPGWEQRCRCRWWWRWRQGWRRSCQELVPPWQVSSA